MNDEERKNTPIFAGCLSYFPRAVAYVARVSKVGNDQHNPGEPMHWAKDKSKDHLGSLTRHLVDIASGDHVDTDGLYHLGKVAWRALAALETKLEEDAELEAMRERNTDIEELKPEPEDNEELEDARLGELASRGWSENGRKPYLVKPSAWPSFAKNCLEQENTALYFHCGWWYGLESTETEGLYCYEEETGWRFWPVKALNTPALAVWELGHRGKPELEWKTVGKHGQPPDGATVEWRSPRIAGGEELGVIYGYARSNIDRRLNCATTQWRVL